MGSGSGGGGGGGSGGSGGDYGGYKFREKGPPTFANTSSLDMEKEVFNQTFTSLSSDYIMQFFGDSLLRSAYESLFEISVELVQNKSWGNIEQKYGVEGNAGCLVKLAHAILEKAGAEQADPKARQVCRIAIDNFLILTVGDEPDVFLKATAQEIIDKIDAKIFASTSSYFLREVIFELVKREESAIPEQIRNDLYELSRYRANDIIDKFENKFKKPGGNVTFRSLFRVIKDNSDWFVSVLRKGR
jgi:hypothetical protein